MPGENPRSLPPPAVSVVIAAYNPGAHLRESIKSVVAQTFTDWELIVVDDGSRQDLSWVSALDPRIAFARQENQGVSIARNHGIAMSRGRFIAFLDQDDRWRPGKLERQVSLLKTGSVFSHTAFDIIDGNGSRVRPGYGERVSYLDMLAGRLGILLSSTVVDRDVLRQVGQFDPGLRQMQDLDLFLRLARRYEASYVGSVEVDYRVHAGNASRDYWRGVGELRDLYAREARLGSSRNEMAVARAIREGKPGVRRTYAFQAIDAARAAAHSRRPLDTVRHLSRAARLSPGAVQHCCVLSAKKRLSH